MGGVAAAHSRSRGLRGAGEGRLRPALDRLWRSLQIPAATRAAGCRAGGQVGRALGGE